MVPRSPSTLRLGSVHEGNRGGVKNGNLAGPNPNVVAVALVKAVYLTEKTGIGFDRCMQPVERSQYALPRASESAERRKE